jgi:two-component SAPR family response regulator
MLSRHYDDFFKILNNTFDSDLINLRTDLSEFQRRLPQLQREIFPEQTIQIQSKPALRIQAFGKTQLWCKGDRLSVSEWVQQKTVRELFYYLLTRTEGVSKEEVGLVFWPDSSPSQLTRQFKNAIYRLRRSVGKDWILYDSASRSYAFNSDLDYRYDVEDFLSYLEDAQQETHPESRLKYLQQAIKLYRHPFASDLDGVWSEPVRRVMYLYYEKAVLDLAEYQYNIGKLDECLVLCQELIKVEPCQEQAYQFCMLSYASLGDSIGVHRNFQLCQKNLERFLNIKPSPKTQSIHDSLSSRLNA